MINNSYQSPTIQGLFVDAERSAVDFVRAMFKLGCALFITQKEQENASFFSSCGELPPDCASPRTFADRCRKSDLSKIAQKIGAAWVVEKEAYFAHFAAKSEQAQRAHAPTLNDIEANERRDRAADELIARPVRTRGSK